MVLNLYFVKTYFSFVKLIQNLKVRFKLRKDIVDNCINENTINI